MPEHTLQAAIWDMDGVIADTGEYHYRAWKEAFRKRGASFTRTDFKRIFGKRNDAIIREFVHGVTPAEIETISDDKEADYRAMVAPHLKALPGVMKLLQSLAAKGVRMAIASSAPLQDIEMITRTLGVKDFFQAITCGAEVEEGKPSPQIFLCAAAKLGAPPANCVVFEDAVAGVAAAKAAGMKCVAITNSVSRDLLAAADLVVDSLEAVNVAVLESLWNDGKNQRKLGA